jgi:hypothetical protein
LHNGLHGQKNTNKNAEVQRHGKNTLWGYIHALVRFYGIASDFVEVFGTRGDFTRPNRRRTIAQDLTVYSGGALESSTAGARNNASGAVMVYGGETCDCEIVSFAWDGVREDWGGFWELTAKIDQEESRSLQFRPLWIDGCEDW